MANPIESTERRRESNHILSMGLRGETDKAQVGNSGFRELGIFLFPHMGEKAFYGVGKYP